MKVFISGSLNIKILDSNVKKRLMNIVTGEFEILVGDADGVDSAIQKFLFEQKATAVKIYCSGPYPRNNFGDWAVVSIDTRLKPGTRAFYTAKDLKMADDADFGLMVWDTKSTGTLSNIIELLIRKKKSVVYISKVKEFLSICKVEDLEKLVSHMSDIALIKAETKLGLKMKIQSLKFEQSSFLKVN